MLIDYDFENDILFFFLEEDYNYEFSEFLSESVVIDYDKNRYPIGLEITKASKLFGSTKTRMHNIAEGTMDIEIDEEKIKLELSLTVKIHKKPTPLKSRIITGLNELKLPSIEASVAILSA